MVPISMLPMAISFVFSRALSRFELDYQWLLLPEDECLLTSEVCDAVFYISTEVKGVQHSSEYDPKLCQCKPLTNALMTTNTEWLKDARLVFRIVDQAKKAARHELLGVLKAGPGAKRRKLVYGDKCLYDVVSRRSNKLNSLAVFTPCGTSVLQITAPPFGTTRGTPIVAGGPSRIPSLITASRTGSSPAPTVPMSFSLLKAARISAVTCSSHRLFWSKQVTIDASALLTVSEPAKIKILYNLIST